MSKKGVPQIYLVQINSRESLEEVKKLKNIKQLQQKSVRFQEPMQSQLCGRLNIYEKEQKQWKAEPKVKRIYKYLKKEPHSKIVKQFKPQIIPRSLKRDERNQK